MPNFNLSEFGIVQKPDFSGLKQDKLISYFPNLLSVKVDGYTITIDTAKYLLTIIYDDIEDNYDAYIQDKSLIKQSEKGKVDPSYDSVIVYTGTPGLHQLYQLLDQLGCSLHELYLITM